MVALKVVDACYTLAPFGLRLFYCDEDNTCEVLVKEAAPLISPVLTVPRMTVSDPFVSSLHLQDTSAPVLTCDILLVQDFLSEQGFDA